MVNGTTTTFSYDRTAQLISRTDPGGTTTFAYDAYGNLTSSARAFENLTAYTYDLADRLTGLTTPDSTAYTFTLDALGRPVRRSDGSATVSYAYVGTGTTAWRTSSGSTSLDAALGPDQSRLALSDGSAFAWLLPDLHGNVAAGIDSAETTVSDAWRYDGYGRTAASTTSSGLANPWTYQGRLDLAPAGEDPFYAAGARAYDPNLGVFTQLDSLAGNAQDPLSLNRYLYAEANPATLIDPDGHRPYCGESCASEGDAIRQWERNKQRARVEEQRRAQLIEDTACHRAGDCSAPTRPPRQFTPLGYPPAPPGYAWSQTPLTGGQYQLLPPGCTIGPDRYAHGDCAPEAGGALLISLGLSSGIVSAGWLAASGVSAVEVAAGAYHAGGLFGLCVVACEKAKQLVAAIGELGGAPPGALSPIQLEQAVSVATKAEARAALETVGPSVVQQAIARSAISRATATSSIIVARAGDDVVIQIYRPGANGFQIIQTVTSPGGAQTVVQFGYDAKGVLTHYDPKFQFP